MGWVLLPSDHNKARYPRIYNYYLVDNPTWGWTKGTYGLAHSGYYTWARGNLWLYYDACIRFNNDTGDTLKLTSVAIKSVSCHSGGEYYWSSSGITNPCYGYGARYTVYGRVSNDGGNSYEESSKYTNTVPDITSSNMNSAGSSVTNTAKFGDPPYEGNKGLILRNYTFTEFPSIEPDGFCYLHFHIDLLDNSKQYQTTIRFVLDPREMEVAFDTVRGPYIWRFCEDNKWHLRRPVQVYGTDSEGNIGWTDPEDLGGR